MNLFKRIVVAMGAYVSIGTFGVLAGGFASYFLVAMLYLTLFPGPVRNSMECAHGAVAGMVAVVGGGSGGLALGLYSASKLIFSEEPVWDITLAQRLRAAIHCWCAGSAVIALAGIADAATMRIVLPFGLLAVLAGALAFAGSVIAGLRTPELEED